MSKERSNRNALFLVTYTGTKEQWDAIYKGYDGNQYDDSDNKVIPFNVICTDGTISYGT